MKRWRETALVALVGLLTAAPLQAQARGGLIGGATYSRMSGDFLVASEYRWNWFAGAYFEIPYRERWVLSIELDFVKKGGYAVTDNTQEIELDVGYVEVPLVATYVIPLGTRWDVGLYGGFGVGVPVTCDVTVSRTSEVSCASGLSSASTEWMIPLGGRLAYQLSSGTSLAVDGRFTVPLSDALEVERFRILTWQFLARWSTTL